MTTSSSTISNIVNEAEIQRVFFFFLGRSCNEVAVKHFVLSNFSLKLLIETVLNSEEYNNAFISCRTSGHCSLNLLSKNYLYVENHSLKYAPRGNVNHVLHSYYDNLPDVNYNIIDGVNSFSVDDVPVCKRLIAAFKVGMHKVDEFDGMNDDRGVWNVVAKSLHKEIVSLLVSEDAEQLCQYLTNAMTSTLSFGLQSLGSFQSIEAAKYLRMGGSQAIEYKLLMKDRIVRFAESLGVLPVENPEQGRYGENIHIDLSHLINNIEMEISVPFDRPRVIGFFGINHNGRLYDAKAAEDAYIANRLKCFNIKLVDEIGGGYGGCSFQLARYGIKSTIFDIPVMNVLQGYYLIKTLGEGAVNLAGEQNISASVNILPWPMFFQRKINSSIVFNRDSMAEFRADVAEKYCLEIKRRKMCFLSINQEVEGDSGDPGFNQLNVGRIARMVGLSRTSRNLYWMRKGYVEEIFE